MKKFQNPEIEIQHFDVEDVITTSSGNGGWTPGENETGGDLL